MKKLRLLMYIVLASFLIVTFVPSAFSADVIKIGVIGPMKYVQGEHHWNGATLAMEEINAKGGIQVGNKKMKIELVKADSNELFSVPDATNAMERLMTRDKVDFVVGAIVFALPLALMYWELAVAVLLITPPIHLVTNLFAYKLKLKKNPW